jgi:hypothetical protein
VNPTYCSPSPSDFSTVSAISRVDSLVSGFDRSTDLQYSPTAARTRSRSSRVSGTALNAALLSFGGFVGGVSLVASGSVSAAVTGGSLG